MSLEWFVCSDLTHEDLDTVWLPQTWLCSHYSHILLHCVLCWSGGAKTLKCSCVWTEKPTKQLQFNEMVAMDSLVENLIIEVKDLKCDFKCTCTTFRWIHLLICNKECSRWKLFLASLSVSFCSTHSDQIRCCKYIFANAHQVFVISCGKVAVALFCHCSVWLQLTVIFTID